MANSIDIDYEEEETAAESAPEEGAGTPLEDEEGAKGCKAEGGEGQEEACDACDGALDDAGASGEEADAKTAGSGEKEEQAPGGKPDKKDLQISELNDRYLRLFAEFDNFRKRTETEKAAMFADGERTVLLKVLPLIDNFERALSTLSEEEKGTAFAEGMEKVYRAFADQLKELGVAPIEAVGKEFDANYHNAVMHVDDEAQPENTVVEEFQKGYMFREKVLRYSMVKVAN